MIISAHLLNFATFTENYGLNQLVILFSNKIIHVLQCYTDNNTLFFHYLICY